MILFIVGRSCLHQKRFGKIPFEMICINFNMQSLSRCPKFKYAPFASPMKVKNSSFRVDLWNKSIEDFQGFCQFMLEDKLINLNSVVVLRINQTHKKGLTLEVQIQMQFNLLASMKFQNIIWYTVYLDSIVQYHISMTTSKY